MEFWFDKKSRKWLRKNTENCFKITLEDNYLSYEVACTIFDILRLKFRRQELCTTFALKLFKSPSSHDYFTPARRMTNTRGGQQLLVEEKKSNKKRCYNAPHNYLARIINQNKEKFLECLKSEQITYKLGDYTSIVTSLLLVDYRGHAQFSVLFQTFWNIRLLCVFPHHMFWSINTSYLYIYIAGYVFADFAIASFFTL